MAAFLGMRMAVTKRLTHAAVLVTGLFLLYGRSTYAADPTVSSLPVVPNIESGLTVQAIGSETGSMESNPLMLTQGAKSLSGSITSPELIINDSTPTTQLNLDNLVNENIFDQSSFDSTDLHSTNTLTTQNQRWMASLLEKTDYDTTRTSELSAYGISTTPVRHLGFTVTPQTSFSPSETDKYSLVGSVQTSQYATSQYSNYELASITPTYSHNFDPRNTGTFGIQAQTYKTTSGLANTVDSIGPSIGWIATLTPKITAKATVGVQESRQYEEGIAPQPWSLDYIYSVDVSYKGIQDVTDFISSRSEYPFGNGTEALLTSTSLTETHILNPRFSLNFAASYLSGQYQLNTTGSLQSLWSGNVGLTYHATEHLDAAAAYQYRYENLTNTPGNAQDNIFTIGIVYHPKAWAL
jgi:hypothetical protein